jgi:hypothetical protein
MKTYRADPSDHDAVARALLEKHQDQQVSEAKKQQYLDYIAKLEAMGKPVTSYVCPECKGAIKTQAAPADQAWDTLSSCPHCEELHLKLTKGATAWAVRLPTA